MKYRYFSVFLLLLILSVGAVSAQDDMASDSNIGITQNDNVLSASEFIIDDSNYDDYFDGSGTILENSSISDGDSLKLGNINDKSFVIDKNLTITSNSSSDILKNVSFFLVSGSDDSVISNLNIQSKNTAITIDNVSNIRILENNINIVGGENSGDLYVIYADLADKLNVKANVITYVGKTNGTAVNNAIRVFNSEDVYFELNEFTITVPSVDVVWNEVPPSSGNYVSSPVSEGIVFKNIINLSFSENVINLTGSSIITDYGYDTIYVVDVNGDGNTVMNNIINADGKNYVYGLLISGNDFTVADNEFVINSNNYANGIDVEGPATGIISDNEIEVTSPVVAYAIYAAMSNGDVSVDYVNNFICGDSYALFGFELGGNKAYINKNTIYLVGNYTTGIAIKVNDEANITYNEIVLNASNEGKMYVWDGFGVETSGVHALSGDIAVKYNVVTTTGEYTVNFSANGSVTDNYLIATELFGDDSVKINNTVLVENNIPIANETEYNLTNETFFLFFDNDGILRDNITADKLTFVGEFSNVANHIFFDKPITLLSDNAVLYDLGMEINSNNVTVDGFKFISDKISKLVSINCSNNVTLTNNEFNFSGITDDNNCVIYIEDSSNVKINGNAIDFSVLTNETFQNLVIHSKYSDNISILENEINANLPSRSIDWTTGIVYSEAICLDGCDDLVLLNNTVTVQSNDKLSTYDTIYAVHIIGDNAAISENNISVTDAPYGYGLVIAGDNFVIENNNIEVGGNEAYACAIDVESNSNGVINDNLIVAAGISAYGIYTANWAGDVKVNITDNTIAVDANSAFGLSLSGSEAIVEDNSIQMNGNFTTGIASKIDEITINNNTILANGTNIGVPLGYDSMGIKTIGVNIATGIASITDNNITSNSKYAIYIGGEGEVTDNELHADLLTGDFAVDYSQDDNILVANNTPEMELDYKVTNDTFFIYFDDEGMLREQITADNLTFIGEFSNLVDIIIIDPIDLLSDNATLNNIPLIINSKDVTVDGFTFVSNKLSEIIAIIESTNVTIVNSKFDVSGLNDSDNYVIFISDSYGVKLDNNEIDFVVLTNGTFHNAAIISDNSTAISISNSKINAEIPSRSINWTTGVVYSEAICLDGCDDSVLLNNTVTVQSNDKLSTYDTIYAVHITGDNAAISENNISVTDAPYGYGLVITGDNFVIENNEIEVGGNEAYACAIDVESNSNGVIDSNTITTTGISVYGIYTANWAGDVKVNITNNTIAINGNSAFAMSLTGSEANVENNTIAMEGNYTTGIASKVDNITVSSNKISDNASNTGDKLGYDSMGIETTGIHIVSGNAIITNNNITTTGEYTVDAKGTGQVTDNYLVAKEYTGDASVDFVDNNTLVANNTPSMYKTNLAGNNLVIYFKNGTRYVVRLTDMWGNVLANQTVVITINNVSYTRVTNVNGAASIPLSLNSGNYTVTAFYAGTASYVNASTENNITILSTVFGENLVKVYRNASQYIATFLDKQGNPLANTTVEFNINGVMYERKTNDNGTARLNIWLEQGEYVITAINPVNGERHANNITVLASITNNTDLQLYYNNGSQYKVTVIGADGKAVGEGVSVTFNINGVFYTRKTNAEGIARLNIKLQPGNYTITAEYGGCKVSNNIEVLPVLYATDLVKKYGTSDQFRALLVDGQGKPYAGQKVTFNIHGVFYERTTNNDGYAVLNIKLGAAIDEYLITSSYGGTSIVNKIIVQS